MLVDNDLQNKHLIGCLHGHQPNRIHVRKSFLTNKDFDMGFT